MKLLPQTLLRLLILAFLPLAMTSAAQENKASPWEEAALNALRAINSGNADLFLAWTHEEEQERLKMQFMEKVLTPVPGVTPESHLKRYGLLSVDQLSRMPAAAFVTMAIPADYAANDAVTRDAMRRSTFRVVGTEKVEDDHYRVRIALHVPLEDQPLDRELVANVVRVPEGWRYNGLK
jgi:hypothetical protein